MKQEIKITDAELKIMEFVWKIVQLTQRRSSELLKRTRSGVQIRYVRYWFAWSKRAWLIIQKLAGYMFTMQLFQETILLSKKVKNLLVYFLMGKLASFFLIL